MTHGTVGAYTNNRCRCEPCTVAMRAYQTEWRNKNRDRARAAGRRYKVKNREKSARYRAVHRDQLKAMERRRVYGLTEDDYQGLLRAQGGRCAICRAEGELHVDHDHETGIVRGLLCPSCNKALGLLRDDPERTHAAAEYLLRHKPADDTLTAADYGEPV